MTKTRESQDENLRNNILDYATEIDRSKLMYVEGIGLNNIEGLVSTVAKSLGATNVKVTRQFPKPPTSLEVNTTLTGFDIVTDKCVRNPRLNSEEFLEAYLFNRVFRSIGVDFGPNADPTFQRILEVGLSIARDTKDSAVEKSQPEKLIELLGPKLLWRVMDELEEAKSQPVLEISDHVHTQSPLIVEFTNETYESKRRKLNKIEEEIEPDSYSPDKGKPELISLPENIDMSVINLLNYYGVRDTRLLAGEVIPNLKKLISCARFLIRHSPYRKNRVILHKDPSAISNIDNAECAKRGLNTRIFFAPQGTEEKVKAIRCCNACSARSYCLTIAKTNNEEGMWGGTTERQRKMSYRELIENKLIVQD